MKKQGRNPSKNDLAQENAELREKLEQQANANQTLVSQVKLSQPHVRASDLMVGIRNVSDNTIGIAPLFPGDYPIQLNGAVGAYEPGQTAVVSYAAWQQLRKGKLVGEGQIVRDDEVLGESYVAAPPDREKDLVPGWEVNLVLEPHAWITGRSESEIRQGIAAMTSNASLRRLRRAVDDKLRELQTSLGDDPERAQKSTELLPTVYALVDQLTTARL